jgi:hypothetical protein
LAPVREVADATVTVTVVAAPKFKKLLLAADMVAADNETEDEDRLPPM